eukprot:GDKJ01013242.1.p1 GENE.GDKJ01013242.1~~GDKJ01013242.1.p1  ORF type:complete len:153 (+),score=39.09 GDKJ01013242.1:69-461(+)
MDTFSEDFCRVLAQIQLESTSSSDLSFSENLSEFETSALTESSQAEKTPQMTDSGKGMAWIGVGGHWSDFDEEIDEVFDEERQVFVWKSKQKVSLDDTLSNVNLESNFKSKQLNLSNTTISTNDEISTAD